MEDQIDLLEFIRYMLFVSHLHKKIGHAELIDTDTFQGKCLDFSQHIADCPIVFASDLYAQRDSQIHSCQEARTKLIARFPLVEHMSFKNYRLVGGACTSFLKSGYIDDLDFFPLVERYPNESDTIREGRVQQVYVDFLQEVEQIYQTSLADKYNFIIYRNEDCTTILLTLKVQDPNKAKTKKKNMKLQFVHRAFESESQMLLCSDLLASQVLFDGMRFRCTYAGMMSLKSNIIPVDFSLASTSMAYRLHKYACKKSFLLAFCGLDPVETRKLLKQKRQLEKANIEKTSKMTKHEKSIRTQAELRQAWLDSTLLLPCGLTLNKGKRQAMQGLFLLGIDFHRSERDNVCLAVTEADYSDYGGISQLEKGGELGEINIEAFLDGKQIHVYAKTVSDFLKSPKVTPIRLPFSQLCHIKKDVVHVPEMKKLFGAHAKDALIAYFDQDEKAYGEVVARRVVELREGMTPIFEKLQQVKWRIVDPGAQAMGSMRPVKITAREGYGELYRSFVCSYAWDAKMTIISAFRRKKDEEECLLVQYLGRDLIKLIFLHVDVLYAKEQSSLYLALCCDDEEKVAPKIVREAVERLENDDSEDAHQWDDVEERHRADIDYWENADDVVAEDDYYGD